MKRSGQGKGLRSSHGREKMVGTMGNRASEMQIGGQRSREAARERLCKMQGRN